MKKATQGIILSIALLAVLLVATQPTKLPSFMLIVPFGLMFVILTLGTALLFAWRSSRLTARHVRNGAFVAAMPMILVVLQSIGQLTLRDLLIIVVFFVLSYFYVGRLSAQRR
ncbi:MAG TPA: hypothetical protein VKQ34_00810 [Candidatus Saccharimonadales bacterium]|nr:hypothetical protein [Candidatus Saccharimonadales bacterium]